MGRGGGTEKIVKIFHKSKHMERIERKEEKRKESTFR
jgi:hypothetical protein